jgi:hypothetical protein
MIEAGEAKTSDKPPTKTHILLLGGFKKRAFEL